MSRLYFLVVCAAISIASVGCCGPMGCGPGCGTSDCFDCDGVGYGERVIPARPLDGLRQMRRNLVCGSGCGEVYYDEWVSTPPDCNDPCCNHQFVGGATPCRPGCWQPGTLLSRLYGVRLYGERFCSGDESSAPCGCGEATCDGGCGTMGMVMESANPPVSSAPVTSGSSCGCAKATPVAVRRRVVRKTLPATDTMTR